jgi:Domain of unknown function (DUF4234)
MPLGKVRNPWAVIGFSIITLGIYSLYWQYQVFREMKDYSGEGIGGPIALVIAILIGIVNVFLLPSEIGNLYQRNGQEKPVRGVSGFWAFIPIAGFFIWVIKTQGALSRFWTAHGATAS